MNILRHDQKQKSNGTIPLRTAPDGFHGNEGEEGSPPDPPVRMLTSMFDGRQNGSEDICRHEMRSGEERQGNAGHHVRLQVALNRVHAQQTVKWGERDGLRNQNTVDITALLLFNSATKLGIFP